MSQLISTYQRTKKSVILLPAPKLYRSLLLWLLAVGLVILPLLPANPMLAAPAIPTDMAANTQQIPIAQIGATADQQGASAASRIQATATGAELQAPFQDLAGSLTTAGLWLRSTSTEAPAAPAFRVMATALGRTPGRSQAFAATGVVQVDGDWARWTRPGVVEEYAVSTDGVRQDFVLLDRPAGAAQLRLELAVTGATVRQATGSDGLSLRVAGSGRDLVYNRLLVTDATGRTLPAQLQATATDRIAIVVDDQDATWPLRIDPTFSDADWISMGTATNVNNTVYALAVSGSDLYVGGQFTGVNSLTGVGGVAKWNGSAWSALGSGVDGVVYALATSGSNLYVGGYFFNAGGVSANYVAKWNGSAWSALGTGANNVVYTLATSGTDLYVGGAFNSAGGVSANRIAKWNGSAWSALGIGVDNEVFALATSGSDLYVGGWFGNAGGVSANYVAKWNGSAWSALGTGLNGRVYALAVNGSNLYVGGVFTSADNVAGTIGVAKWNGSVWSALGAGVNGRVNALAVNGSDLYVGGFFTSASGLTGINSIAKWDGSTWSALGSGVNIRVHALAMSGSDLYVGGDFTTAGGKASNYLAKAQLPPLPPEIDVKGNNVSIVSDDSTPSSGDYTDFGSVPANSGTVARTFTIQNSGAGALSVSAPTLNGANAGDFAISSAPASSVAANGSTTFQVTFDPSAAGVRTATVSIGNNDSNENPYTFAIQGTGTAPEIDVTGNDVAIANGDSTPSASDATDFGTAAANGNFATSSLFFIANVGDGQLDISDITLSGTGKDEFRIVFFSDPPASVPANHAPEDSFVFFVDFGPRTPGLHEATVSIANNDSDENPYTFAIRGTGTSAAPSLSIPSTSRDASNGTFSVPVNFTSDGASIASVGFGLDYQESCLTFDATDGNSDGIPDAITGLPSGFVASISHDANDTGSELDISLFDSTAPMGALSDGALLTVAFSVKPACITTDGTTTDVTLNFAGDPAPSFSDAAANDVTGTSSGATIALQFNATPTAINLSNNSVAENAVSGTTVGTLSTIDPDSGDSHTYALVSGSGDSDNASFVLDGATLKTAASFDFETKSSYSVRIRTTDNGGLNGTFEQALTINVTNVNEAPVAVADADDPRTTVFVGGQATTINVLANDTDPENDPLSVGSVNTSGTQGSVTNNGANVSYTAPNANGSSSFSYQASDGALSSTDATVNVTYVKNDLRGDCNATGSLTAADFVATILEIFDTNDMQHNSNPAWWLIYTGDFAGSPRGCDSNAGKNGSNNSSDSVSAGDIVCTVLLFFKGNCGASVVAASQQTTAQLTVADATAQPGQTATVTVNFNPAGNQVAAASFALVIDPSQLGFDATDTDSDGVPDAVQLTVPAGMSKSVQWNAAQSRLEVALFGAALPLPTLGEGVLATVNFQVAANATPGATELGVALASLGDTEGQDLAVTPTSGTLTISGDVVRNLLYLPVAVR